MSLYLIAIVQILFKDNSSIYRETKTKKYYLNTVSLIDKTEKVSFS